MNLIDKIEKEQIDAVLAKRAVPEFGPGDTLRIDVKVVEGTRERVQAFEGVCIGRKNDGIGSSFTVRKMSYGEGVERVFPLYSPKIQAQEPLSTEIQAFIDWIQFDRKPISDSKNGLEIVKVLQRAQEGLVG